MYKKETFLQNPVISHVKRIFQDNVNLNLFLSKRNLYGGYRIHWIPWIQETLDTGNPVNRKPWKQKNPGNRKPWIQETLYTGNRGCRKA